MHKNQFVQYFFSLKDLFLSFVKYINHIYELYIFSFE